jgi:M6 family metalloprotease-like protein
MLSRSGYIRSDSADFSLLIDLNPLFFIRIILLCLCACAVEAQEWRILALRVDFPLEDPDEFTTTGQGQFDLRNSQEASEDYALPYDTPPHDRIYFENHLEALRRYYDVVSEGQVEIGYEVYPRANDAVYTLPISMLRYGNGRSTQEIGERWIDLLRAALELAQVDPDGPDLAAYNSFLVFHAGVGHETGQLNDIRSVFLQQSDFARFAGGPLTVGGVEIDRAWILPESPSLRGRGGLNGLLAKFFGNQLGLPGLSNFADGLPAVGGWSLMDVGANALGFVLRDSLDAVVGFAPPHPMAWSKAKLGWIEPLVVRRDTVVSILASDRRGVLPKAVRVPIDNDEYYLLENRQQRGRRGAPEGAEIFGADADEIVWIDEEQIDFSDGDGGVWLGVDEYDAFIPGSGILVWHVDEGVIAASDEGAFNNKPEQQGIALEEADGYRDIGNPVFERLRQIEGSPDDPFYVGGQTLFAPNSQPDTRSNEGWATGVEIEVLSELGDTMQVAIRFRHSAPGWPLAIEGGRQLQAIDIDGDGAVEMVGGTDTGVFYKSDREAVQWVTVNGFLLAVGDADGDGVAEFFVYDRLNRAVAALDKEGQVLWRQELGADVVSALFSAHSAVATEPLLVMATAERFYVFAAENGDEIQRQDLRAIGGIAAADIDGDGADEFAISSANGLDLLSGAGLATWWNGGGDLLLAPASGDIDGDGRDEIALVDVQGNMRLLNGDGERFSLSLADSVSVAPTLGDVDGDGLLEVVQVAANGTVHALRGNGLEQADFPAALPRFSEAGALRYEALFADVDGDGAQEIWLGAEDGVYALNAKAQLAGVGPFLTAQPLRFAPAIFDIDGDGVWELAAVDGGAYYLWSTRGTGRVGWGQRGADAGGQRNAATAVGGVLPVANTLLPASLAYYYPNPVRAGQLAHVRFYLAEAAAVELFVYDALGARVEHIKAQAQAGDNELAWSIDGYTSGLYIGRLEAKAANAKGQVLLKMAVSR